MGIRNCEDIGENLQKIVSRLMANDDLVKLLYYTDKDPYSKEALTTEQKKELIFNKLIKVVPRVGPKELADCILTIKVDSARTNPENGEFKDVIFYIESFVPLTQWIIKDSNLRPFAILGQTQKSLVGKTINGLGRIQGGDFDLNFLTEEVSCYTQTFIITSYE